MPSATSHHRHKRPYQPSITSYFAHQDTAASAGETRPQLDRSSSSTPALPSSVQSNLLNVGMRVRKAVPGGYRNKAPPSTFALTDDTGPGALPPSFSSSQSLSLPLSAAVLVATEATARGGGALSVRPAELVPFCGLHKTGGLDDHYYRQADEAAMAPFLSSQESNASSLSTDSTPAAMRAGVGIGRGAPARFKRGFEEDDDEEEDDDDDGVEAGFGNVRVHTQGTRSADLDFGEADFLKPPQELEGMDIG